MKPEDKAWKEYWDEYVSTHPCHKDNPDPDICFDFEMPAETAFKEGYQRALTAQKEAPSVKGWIKVTQSGHIPVMSDGVTLHVAPHMMGEPEYRRAEIRLIEDEE